MTTADREGHLAPAVQLGSEVDARDVYCTCGRYMSERSGMRALVALQFKILQGWPMFSYV